MSTMNNVLATVNAASKKEEMNMMNNIINNEATMAIERYLELKSMKMEQLKGIARAKKITFSGLRKEALIQQIIFFEQTGANKNMDYVVEELQENLTPEQKLAAMNPGFINATIKKEESSGYSVNPLDDPEVQAMDVSDNALLKPIEESEEAAEVTIPVGDLDITSDKMVIEKEEVKMEQKKVVATQETKEELICQLLLVEWCLQSTVEPYVAKDGKKYRLFFPAKSDKYEKGTYMSMEGPAKKVAFSVFDTVYGKNWGTIGVYKLWVKMASYGFCHMVQGNSKAREENSLVRDKDGNTIWVYFVHMSTKEREKLVKQYKRIEANANNAGFTGIDAARQYVLAKLGK